MCRGYSIALTRSYFIECFVSWLFYKFCSKHLDECRGCFCLAVRVRRPWRPRPSPPSTPSPAAGTTRTTGSTYPLPGQGRRKKIFGTPPPPNRRTPNSRNTITIFMFQYIQLRDRVGCPLMPRGEGYIFSYGTLYLVWTMFHSILILDRNGSFLGLTTGAGNVLHILL